MKKILAAILVCTLAFTSCKKNDTGGKATLVAFPAHHSQAVKGATIYVKFDAEDYSSDMTTNYDLKITGEANENHVHIEGLRYGKYYLYAVGYDSTIMQTVTGGIGVKIKWSDRKEEMVVNVPVTE
jgi:hypothetical protein